MAYAAAEAVSKNPARAYNPLFIYGGTGLGKTHLMHAVGNALATSRRPLKVAYVTSEDFTNQFIHAVREQTLAKFRKRYRNVDVLMVDDMTETGGTLTTAATTLKAAGARNIFAGVSHAILNPAALEKLKKSDISELITTNSTPIKNTDGVPITVLDVASLLGEGIKRIHYGESVSSLFKVGAEGQTMKL